MKNELLNKLEEMVKGMTKVSEDRWSETFENEFVNIRTYKEDGIIRKVEYKFEGIMREFWFNENRELIKAM